MIEALAVRKVGAPTPTEPNFVDRLVPFELDESTFRPAPPVALVDQPRTFSGYRRPPGRGVGTRNVIVILGTTSRTASLVRQLAARLQPLARVHPKLDGIVAIAHTEGGGPEEPNNALEVLRALAGFMVSPNVGAVLAVDYGIEPINNDRLRQFMTEHGYPLAGVPHAFLSARTGLAATLAAGEKLVRGWLGPVSAQERTDEPLSGLRVALQCGGSDAFSGISGNPLAGAVVHELIRHGGTGVLCETDEITGGEEYIMRNIRDLATARAVLEHIASFKARLAWHGVTPESNPSAGNKFRGLYNIVLKSLGAVHKKDPRTRVDHVIDYAEPLTEPGFYFMNSPGNDLEGIAGQAAAGCNLFLFVTGNGSITNFPFIPTLKITTTSQRHELLVHEMDINAGRYLEGQPMESLASDSFECLIATASGRRTQGEKAGHSQTSLWRNWRQTDASRIAEIRARATPDGRPLREAGGPESGSPEAERKVLLRKTATGYSSERVALVLPTSMCAAQIAQLAAAKLNQADRSLYPGVDRFVALPHSEGCGFGGEALYRQHLRTYQGYSTHPNVVAALLLEHGCEKIPNDSMRRKFEQEGLPLTRFGWASVQMDGGIQNALTKIGTWFEQAAAGSPTGPRTDTGVGSLSIGLLSGGAPSPEAAAVLGRIASEVVAQGGTILVPETDALLASPTFRHAAIPGVIPHATLEYGESPRTPGFHCVSTESDHWVENLTGLGACGAHLFVGLLTDSSQQGHPLLSLIQVADCAAADKIASADLDLALTGQVDLDEIRLWELIISVAEGSHLTAATAGGMVDFQLTRGLLGVST